MRPECPVCGKLFWCDYPHLWAYKRGNQFICSWSCLRKYDEKEAEKMAYRKIRKDGTPAKVPGKKKEEPKVELVYDPEIAEEYRREQAQKEANARAKAEAEQPEPTVDWIEEANARAKAEEEKDIVCRVDIEPLEICAVRSRVCKEIHFTVSDDEEMMMAYRGTWLQFSVGDWKKLSGEILLALKQLGMEV